MRVRAPLSEDDELSAHTPPLGGAPPGAGGSKAPSSTVPAADGDATAAASDGAADETSAVPMSPRTVARAAVTRVASFLSPRGTGETFFYFDICDHRKFVHGMGRDGRVWHLRARSVEEVRNTRAA